MFTCPVCNKQYTQSGSLKSHLIIHTGEKPFMCDVCDKGFTDKTTLRKHRLCHTGEKPYICDICQKGFVQNITLKRHYLTHIKPYKCFVCQKAFSLEIGLQTHLSHSNICNKLFEKSFQMNEELRLQKHVDESVKVLHETDVKDINEDIVIKHNTSSYPDKIPFICNICNAKFMYEIHLKAHFLLHDSGSNLFCERCGDVFNDSREYENHIKIHNDVTITFLCEFCRKSFKTLKKLKKHESKHKQGFPEDGVKDTDCPKDEVKETDCPEDGVKETDCPENEVKEADESSIEHDQMSLGSTEHKASNDNENSLIDDSIENDSSDTHHCDMEPQDCFLMCETCGEIFYSNDDFSYHLLLHALCAEKNKENSNSGNTGLCEKCGAVFGDEKEFLNHIASHVKLCEKCGDIFDNEIFFSNHLPRESSNI